MSRRFRFIVALFAAALPLTGGAQNAGSSVSLGLIGGLNLSTISSDNITGTESKVGFDVGGFLHQPLAGVWALQAEVHYTTKGTQATESGVSVKFNPAYLEVPILFRAAATESANIKPFLELGPALALNMACTVSGASGSISVSAACSELGELRTFDAGLLGGAGLEFAAGRSTVSAGVRYNIGVLDIVRDGSAKNRNLQFVASIRFP